VGLRNTRLVRGESLTAINKRIALANQLDGAFTPIRHAGSACLFLPLRRRREAHRESKELEAFDLNKESRKCGPRMATTALARVSCRAAVVERARNSSRWTWR
jgi:hypothetical protein